MEQEASVSEQNIALREDRNIVQADATSIMEVISRAASDPKTDVEKLKGLLDLYERITARSAKSAYTEALSAVQQEIPPMPERGKIKNKAGGVQSTYALWEDINDIIKPILAKHGFALSFRTGFQDGKIIVTGILAHKAGHSEETTIYLPADASGSKNDVQAVGSSTSYGKRYTAQALLNMTSRGEDDDGIAAGGIISEDQAEKIFDLIKRTKADTAKFCKHFGVEAVPDLRAKDFERAVTALNLKEKKVQQ
jgi:hypothetical protein